MRFPKSYAFACLGAMGLLLSGCGGDFTKGFGELEGWGGYTKQYGEVDEGMNKPVGLCSYTGGCMPEKKEDDGVTPNSFKGTKSAMEAAPADAPDAGGGGSAGGGSSAGGGE